jgi:hypothetical protein
LGDGLLDIAAAVQYALSIGVQDVIVEQEGGDSDAEIEDMLERSYAFLKPLL